VVKAEQELAAAANAKKTSRTSETLVRAREAKALSDVFDVLRRNPLPKPVTPPPSPAAPPRKLRLETENEAPEGDGAGEWLVCAEVDPKVLAKQPSLAKITAGVVRALGDDALVSRQYFIKHMRKALHRYRSAQRGPVTSLLAPSGRGFKAAAEANKRKERALTFKPKVNHRSETIAAFRGRSTGEDIVDVLYAEAERYSERQSARAAAEEKRVMEECTFKPAMETEKSKKRIKARYPNERGSGGAVRAWRPAVGGQEGAGGYRGLPDDVAEILARSLTSRSNGTKVAADAEASSDAASAAAVAGGHAPTPEEEAQPATDDEDGETFFSAPMEAVMEHLE